MAVKSAETGSQLGRHGLEMGGGERKQAQRGKCHADKHHGPGRGEGAGPFERNEYAPASSQHSTSRPRARAHCASVVAVPCGAARISWMAWCGIGFSHEIMPVYDSVS